MRVAAAAEAFEAEPQSSPGSASTLAQLRSSVEEATATIDELLAAE
jgi:hypothetical protein